MQMIMIFGLPGTGKTYVGKILEQRFGYYFYDGDKSIPARMKETLDHKGTVTDEMRDEFFSNLIKDVSARTRTHAKIVVAQTFIKEKYRNQFLSAFPKTKCILVGTRMDIREKRLKLRTEYPLEEEYSRQMCLKFEPVGITHDTLYNDTDGDKEIIKQLDTLLRGS